MTGESTLVRALKGLEQLLAEFEANVGRPATVLVMPTKPGFVMQVVAEEYGLTIEVDRECPPDKVIVR